MNDHSAGYAELPRTAYLDHTLRRARNAAEQRSHRYVTLEHLLLALLDDPDAVALLKGFGADVAVIHATVTDAVNNRMASLVMPGGGMPSFSYKFDSVFVAASGDAMRIGRATIDGALAVIAIAREPDSNASAILAASGFQPAAALQSLGAGALPQQRTPPTPSPAKPAQLAPRAENPAVPRPEPQPRGALESRPIAASYGASMTSGEVSMEDMLASVRNILEAEERKERGLPPENPRPVPQQGVQPRFEPHLRADGSLDRRPQRSGGDLRHAPQTPERNERRIEPSLGQTHARLMREQAGGIPGRGAGLSDPSMPSLEFDNGPAVSPPQTEKRRKGREANAPRGRAETPSLVAKVLEHIPRRARVAVAQTVQIRLSKEEAGMIFGRPASRGHPPRGGEQEGTCRAVTVRISAPEGGFFIEAAAPETQWIFDRPSFLGEEAFGTWAWTLIPNDTGSYVLTVSMSARDIDGIGLIGDLKVPQQAITVRVRGNFWRGFGRLISTLLVLIAGVGLAVGAYYALKITGKLPHWL